MTPRSRTEKCPAKSLILRFLNNFPQSKFSHLCHFYMHKKFIRWGQQIIVVVVVVVVSYIIVWFNRIRAIKFLGRAHLFFN
jgi:hypothetical protein